MIREAQLIDAPRIAEIGRKAHAKSAYKKVPFNRKMAISYIKDRILDDQACVFVTELDGIIEGVFIGVIGGYPFSTVKCAFDEYIITTKKGTGQGRHLIKTFVEWAKAKKVPESNITLKLGSGVDDWERTAKLFNHLGFEQIGQILIRS